MLQPADVGPGGRLVSEELEGDWRLEFTLSLCPSAAREWESRRHAEPRQRARELAADSGRRVREEVNEFRPGWAARHLAEWRTQVTSCAHFTAEAPYEFRLAVVARDFAGDGAVLIRYERVSPEPFVGHVAIVRVGNLVGYVDVGTAGDVYARDVAGRAALRLG
jgi:hypothetical protein